MMPDYAKMYGELFRATTKAIEVLQQAQIKAEEMYLSDEEPLLFIVRPERDGGDNGPTD
ncbi:MAG: hypothetical protein GX572_05110 [Clostridia bacterium]|nr:hypothetical protein [Clostridia bacterium]